jgi:hypothetical protein
MKTRIIKLKPDNVPEVEVIAINTDNECLVGYIYLRDDLNIEFYCESEECLLTRVTHFIHFPNVWLQNGEENQDEIV